MQLVVPDPRLANLKRFEENKLFYDQEDVRGSSPKTVEAFLPGICFQLNLPNVFQNSARNQLSARLKMLRLTVKNPARFGSKSAKRTTLLSRFKNVIL